MTSAKQPQTGKAAPSLPNHELEATPITSNVHKNIAPLIMTARRARNLGEDSLPPEAALTPEQLSNAIAQRQPTIYRDEAVHPSATISESTSGVARLMSEQIKQAQLSAFEKPKTFGGAAIE